MMDAGKEIAQFLAFLKEAEARYLSAQEDERIANDETQDILHALELRRCGEERAASLAKLQFSRKKGVEKQGGIW